MDASEFKKKWGLTQDEMAVLMQTSRSTIAHWLGKGKHDSDRCGTTASQLNISFWDLLLTMWLENDLRFPKEYEVFQAIRDRGKGEVFQNHSKNTTEITKEKLE